MYLLFYGQEVYTFLLENFCEPSQMLQHVCLQVDCYDETMRAAETIKHLLTSVTSAKAARTAHKFRCNVVVARC